MALRNPQWLISEDLTRHQAGCTAQHQCWPAARPLTGSARLCLVGTVRSLQAALEYGCSGASRLVEQLAPVAPSVMQPRQNLPSPAPSGPPHTQPPRSTSNSGLAAKRSARPPASQQKAPWAPLSPGTPVRSSLQPSVGFPMLVGLPYLGDIVFSNRTGPPAFSPVSLILPILRASTLSFLSWVRSQEGHPSAGAPPSLSLLLACL